MRRPLLLLATLFVSCSNPVCGCTPAMAGVVIEGILRSANGVPRAGMLLEGEIAILPCFTYGPVPGDAVSQPDGRFLLELYATPSDSFCVRLAARDTTTGSLAVELPNVLRVRGRYPPFETVAHDLVLPP